nr:hypothetical protein [Rhizobium rhizogenes]
MPSSSTHGIEAGLELLRSGGVQAIAGIRQVLNEKAAADDGLRTLADSFLEIRQAICVPKSREAEIYFVNDFIRHMISSGVVAEAFVAS